MTIFLFYCNLLNDSQAMVEGQWVLIEDLDKASIAVLASFTSFAETELDTVRLVSPHVSVPLQPNH